MISLLKTQFLSSEREKEDLKVFNVDLYFRKHFSGVPKKVLMKVLL